jgi:hypothetical protein
LKCLRDTIALSTTRNQVYEPGIPGLNTTPEMKPHSQAAHTLMILQKRSHTPLSTVDHPSEKTPSSRWPDFLHVRTKFRRQRLASLTDYPSFQWLTSSAHEYQFTGGNSFTSETILKYSSRVKPLMDKAKHRRGIARMKGSGATCIHIHPMDISPSLRV